MSQVDLQKGVFSNDKKIKGYRENWDLSAPMAVMINKACGKADISTESTTNRGYNDVRATRTQMLNKFKFSTQTTWKNN